MSWLNNGMEHESDLLSVALGESGLDLDAHGPLSNLGKNETTEHNSGLAGATLSLESTSTPNDLLNWAFLLSNTNSQNLASTQDGLSNLFEPFNECYEFKPASEHPTINNKTSKTSIPNPKDLQSHFDLYLGNGDFNTIPQNTNRSNSHLGTSLKDLLSAEDFSGSLTKKAVNGLSVNSKDPTRKYVIII